MPKPFSVSQVWSAAGSVAFSWTVRYGPTTSCFVTVTPPPLPASALPADGALSESPRFWQLGGGGQFCGGEMICVCVLLSSAPKTTSALRPTSTVPEIGSTHANDDGSPWYLIWSYRVDWSFDT